MPRKPRARRQRVILRPKQRGAHHRRLHYFLIGSLFTGLLAMLGSKMVSSGEGWVPRFIQKHTPSLEIKAPDTLADLPLLKDPPDARFSWWVPGAETRVQSNWLQQYPALSRVRFEKRYLDNHIVAHLEPRVPLVRWGDRGVDKEGVVFALASPRWAVLPKASFPAAERLPLMGRWLSEVSRVSDFWSQVVGVSEDQRMDMWFDMGTGTRVAWGAPDARLAQQKARCLAVVLDDAHRRFSGAAAADLRFFDEGRVIVNPKRLGKV